MPWQLICENKVGHQTSRRQLAYRAAQAAVVRLRAWGLGASRCWQFVVSE